MDEVEELERAFCAKELELGWNASHFVHRSPAPPPARLSDPYLKADGWDYGRDELFARLEFLRAFSPGGGCRP